MKNHMGVARWAVMAFLCGGSLGHAATLDEVISRLERAEKEVQSVRFDFVQTTTVSIRGPSVESRGTATFQRPDRFRVDLSAPEKQAFVSDGKRIWVYFPDRGQALKDSVDRWARSAGFPQGLTPFQMNVETMKKKYQFSLSEESDGPVLTLTPVSPGDFPFTLRLWVDMDTGVARKTALVSENVTAVVRVDNVRVNPSVDARSFKFVPPKGVEVLEIPHPSKDKRP